MVIFYDYLAHYKVRFSYVKKVPNFTIKTTARMRIDYSGVSLFTGDSEDFKKF